MMSIILVGGDRAFQWELKNGLDLGGAFCGETKA